MTYVFTICANVLELHVFLSYINYLMLKTL